VVLAAWYYSGGWISVHHSRLPWQKIGTFSLFDQPSGEHKVTVFTRGPIAVPGDDPEIRLVIRSPYDEVTIQRTLESFRFNVGPVGVRSNVLEIYPDHPFITNQAPGLSLRIENGQRLLTEDIRNGS